MPRRPVPLSLASFVRPARWRRFTHHFAATAASFGAAGALLLSPSCEPPPPEPEPEPQGVVLEAKPVEPPCSYRDTFGAPRSGGRVHLGVDILAASGNDLFAVVSGEVTKLYYASSGSISGNGLRITQPDGTYFLYFHLLRLASGISVGTKVTAGQLVGYVGQTGNAGTPHLHLEIHPQGGAAVNPTPIVAAIGAC